MSHKIFILLPVHNRREITKQFIDCLLAQSYTNYHLILIDDGSVDDTAEMVLGLVKSSTVITGLGSWWWAGSLQKGIDWIKENKPNDRDIVVFANDDITFNNDFLQLAVNILERIDSTLLLPQIRNAESGMIEETGVTFNTMQYTFSTAPEPEAINCLPSRGLFMRVVDLKKIGNFHPRLLPHYLSDYEFTIRAKKKGMNLCTSNNLFIELNKAETGIRSLEKNLGLKSIRLLFSKKSTFNPFYHTNFILLTGVWSSIPGNLIRVWGRTITFIIKVIGQSLPKKLR